MRKPCCDKQGNNKGAWSKQEDQKLIDYITIHGEGLHRCGKSCRLRWINYLRPDIKRGNFAQDEEDLIIKLHALLGNRVSDAASSSLEENETSAGSSDINLDLTIAVPSSAHTSTSETRPENCDTAATSEVRSETLPTLLLFL
ncbi:hypothetical protein GH714_013751 [Hevea brasiliensis]|uniref:Uncharacterized protein n=1 Tax=Hevea brasiliensis TaxID=3981 RepID=A0A6A6LIU5_HEVBR|nr:hypothetical protein GH714_013751 [Hevea brasiliensis]